MIALGSSVIELLEWSRFYNFNIMDEIVCINSFEIIVAGGLHFASDVLDEEHRNICCCVNIHPF
jgi:hypothetical protein